MNINARLKKLEIYLKLTEGKTDLSHLTEQELDFLITAYLNDATDDPEVKRLENTISWGNECSHMTEEELDREISKLLNSRL